MVLSIVKGETPAAEAARKHGLRVAEIERFFRSLKEGCVRQHNFADFAEAPRRLAAGSPGTTSVAPSGARLSQPA